MQRFHAQSHETTINMNAFSAVFLSALALTTAARLWLAVRHVRYVQAHRVVVPAGFTEQIGLDAHQKAADYTAAKTRLRMVHTALEMALLLLLTFGGLLQRLDDFWVAAAGDGYARGVALIASAVVIMGLVDLPLDLYRTFVIEARFGFNKMTVWLFISDLAKQAALGAVFGLPLVLCALWLMAKMGSYWWLYVWLVWTVFNLLVLAIYPVFIAPLFNKFSPLEDAEIKSRIEKLLARCGFQSQGLFVMDGSKRSSHGNAYFTGFGRAKRIVLFDTLIKSLELPEVEAVLAHELGHFRRHHVVKRIVITFVASLVFLWIAAWLIAQPWFFQGLGVSTPSTAMALLLLFIIMPVFTFVLQPLFSFYSRRHEFEADAYAANYADARALTNALAKLYKDNASTLTPDPLHSAFYDSHPPAAARIARLQALSVH